VEARAATAVESGAAVASGMGGRGAGEQPPRPASSRLGRARDGVADRRRAVERRAADRQAASSVVAATKWKTEQRRARAPFPKNITSERALCTPSEVNPTASGQRPQYATS
jgi:hypothetical protein